MSDDTELASATPAEGLAFAARHLPMFEAAGTPHDDAVAAFVGDAYESGVVAVFDWIEWRDQAHVLLETSGAMERTDFEDLRRLLTLLIRQDNFAEGTLAHAIEQGWVHRILHRMREVCAPAAPA